MAMPLIMTGPGGEFVTRFDIKGRELVKTVGQGLESNPDRDAQGGFFHRQGPRRRPNTLVGRLAGGVSIGPDDLGDRPLRRPDAFTRTAAPLPAARGYRADGLPCYHVPVAAVPDEQAMPDPALTSFVEAGSTVVPPPSAARPSGTGPLKPLSTRNLPANAPSLLAALEAWLGNQQAALAQLARALPSLGDLRPAVAPAASDPSVFTAPSTLSTAHDEPHTQTVAHPDPHPRPAPGARVLADHAGIGGRAGHLQSHGLRARRGADRQGRLAAAGQQGSLFGA